MMVATARQEPRLLLEQAATLGCGARSPERPVEERKPRQPSRGWPWQTGTWIWAEATLSLHLLTPPLSIIELVKLALQQSTIEKKSAPTSNCIITNSQGTQHAVGLGLGFARMHGKGGIFLNTTTGDTHVILEFGLGFLTVLHEAFVFVLLSQIIFLEDDQGRSIQEPQKKTRI